MLKEGTFTSFGPRETDMQYLAYYRRKRPASPNFSVAKQRAAAASYYPNAEYTELEVRKGQHRPALAEAVEHAKRERATLVIPKLGRLSRNPAVTHLLMESGIDFIALDQPTTNRGTIHILAATAEEDTRARTERVKAAFARMRAAGAKLGSANPKLWKGREHKRGWKKGAKIAGENRAATAKSCYQYVLPEIKRRREKGESLADIVEWLNDAGHRTTAFKPFTQTALWRIIKRYLGEEYLGPIKSKDHPLAHVVAANRADATA
jgi:DNA invertase Pin-like site-specific DNA recombinase